MNKKVIRVCTLSFLFAAACSSWAETSVIRNVAGIEAGQPAQGLMMRFKEGTPQRQSGSAAASQLQQTLQAGGWLSSGAILRIQRASLDVDVLTFARALSAKQTSKLVQQVGAIPNLEWIEPSYAPVAEPTSEKVVSGQSATLSTDLVVKASLAHDYSATWGMSTGLGARIAILDSGITLHQELNGNVLKGAAGGHDFIYDLSNGYDRSHRDEDPSDLGAYPPAGYCSGITSFPYNWQGTEVAGVAAAAGVNGPLSAGVAYNAKVMPMRVNGVCGLDVGGMADAMIWASGGNAALSPPTLDVSQRAHVINVSLNFYSPTCPTFLREAIESAVGRGVPVVVSAGDFGSNTNSYSPANCPGALVVTTAGSASGRSPNANFGSNVALSVMPNSYVVPSNQGRTAPDAQTNFYKTVSGTRYAAPEVAGVIALMQSRRLQAGLLPLSVAEITSALRTTATPFEPGACTVGCGAGVLNPTAAVRAAMTTAVPLPPAASSRYCLPGSTLDTRLGYCADSTHVYGPFTNTMVNLCVRYGGGDACTTPQVLNINGQTVSILRWSKQFASALRGTGTCPLGSVRDTVFTSYCVENPQQSASGIKEVYGPFPQSLIQRCLGGGGGGACYTTRWSYAYFDSMQ
jgi:serine protease